MGGTINKYVCKVLVGNYNVRKKTGKPRCIWEDNIKMGLQN
jgi:hypothetical protein